MQSIHRVIFFGLATFVAIGVLAQGPTKPTISSVAVLPSEHPLGKLCRIVGWLSRRRRQS
jgi:hypothetical protein